MSGVGAICQSAYGRRPGVSRHSHQNSGTLKQLISRASEGVPNILRFAKSIILSILQVAATLGYAGTMLMSRLLIIYACLLASSAAVADPSCSHPELNAFLEKSPEATGPTYFPAPTAKFLPFMLGDRQLQWMGASWEGPRDGALFVLDCTGTRIAGMRMGHLEKLRPGPIISGLGQALEVVYISGQGTGVREESVNIVSFSGDSIIILWRHEASDLVAQPDLGADYTDTWSWHYSDDGAVIRVSGRRSVGESPDTEHGWAQQTSHMLSNETFCWKPQEKAYSTCNGR
jgi:hypothetical protein